MPHHIVGAQRDTAAALLLQHHYTHSVPAGKSHYVAFGPALVVWALPANPNLAKYVLGRPGNVWELSRLWAPDEHDPNLLTQAIAAAIKVIVRLEDPEALVAYADPRAGHHGGVYRAAGWQHHGTSGEARAWRAPDGTIIARRAFHSGRRALTKPEVQALGYVECTLAGKERFVKLLARRPLPTAVRARQLLTSGRPLDADESRIVGQYLLDTKAAMPHGRFGPWLAANTTLARRSAQRHMAAAKGATVAHLDGLAIG